MFSATVVSDNDEWLRDLQQVHAVAGERIETYARREVRPFVSQQVDKTLRQEPRVRQYPNDYPLEWASEKQRKYVMAKLRRENNLPYRRTHDFVHAWHVTADYTRGLSSIVIYNDAETDDGQPLEQYVTGRRQQPYHHITGWPSSGSVIQVIVLETEDFVRAGLPRVVREVFE